MSQYIELPIETNSSALSADILDRIMSNIPGWVPREGHLEVWVIEAVANALAQVLGVASRIPRSVFRYYGKSLLGLDAIDGATATALTTWTFADSAGHTVYAGTTVAYRTSAGVLIPFVVMSDIICPAGQTVVMNVQIAATDVGVIRNGLPIQTLIQIDALAFVQTVASTTVTAGGVDAETDDQYLDRLAEELRLLTPRPILAADFAVMSRRVTGVARAVGLDNYLPSDHTFGHEKMVTVSLIDTTGQPVSAPIKAAVVALLQSLREVNFVVNTMDPTYTDVAISYGVVGRPGYSKPAIQTAIDAALAAFLSPATWGSSATDSNLWEQRNKVRFTDIAHVIHAIPGVDWISALTLNGTGADITLAGDVSLPHVTSATGVVS